MKKKHELYKKTQEILKIFENRYGSLTCGKLLNLTQKHDDHKPSPRDHLFYLNRPCTELIGGAAEILEDSLKRLNIL